MANLLKEQKEANETLYDEAYSYYISGNYILAIQKFTELNGYKDSDELLLACRKELAKLQQATTISAGIHSSVGMIRHGKVYLAGNDEYSWKSELEGWNNIISVSVKGNFAVALKDDGTVVMAGKIPEYYVGTKTWNDIVAVSAGYGFTLGLKSNGTVVAAGYDHDGQIDVGSWENITDYEEAWKSIFDENLRWHGNS